jgi:PPOX class probable FMN-dependent enzyme
MSEANGYRITTIEQLRAVIGEVNPAVQVKIGATIDEYARAFIARSPFVVLSTADREGHLDVSPKGDGAGFVLVEDERTLLIPDRSGNKLVFGLQNIVVNPHVAVLFIVPGTGETLRVNGSAELTTEPAVLERLAARGKPAQLAIRVTVEDCFFHCAKAFLRAQLWKPETWPPNLRVSFGKMLAGKMGGDAAVAEAIDRLIDDDYRNNL